MKDIEQKAEYLAKETYRDNPTDLKGVDYKYNTDRYAPIKRKAFIKGFIAGATEERERGKRFAEWCLLNAEIIDPNLYYMVDETGTKKYTVNDLFDMYMERENKALNN